MLYSYIYSLHVELPMFGTVTAGVQGRAWSFFWFAMSSIFLLRTCRQGTLKRSGSYMTHMTCPIASI